MLRALVSYTVCGPTALMALFLLMITVHYSQVCSRYRDGWPQCLSVSLSGIELLDGLPLRVCIVGTQKTFNTFPEFCGIDACVTFIKFFAKY